MKVQSKYVLDRDDAREILGMIDCFMAKCPDDALDYDCERIYGAMFLLKDALGWDDGLIITDSFASVEHGVTRQ